ncbi:biotin/lipoyl-containing protein [Saccharopolyspora sp. CA-218241]|uniref:biotin/lipoyl-containing protein n=1 Tax=Saccharopolyspora sp. CA-218241 TaxID=3240027 RepID=UPI003D958411
MQGSDVQMPALGESVSEGTVTRWLKQVGDTVEVDEPLLEVSTDKVDTEIPSPVAGTLLEIAAEEDDTVEVGAKLAVIGEQGAAAPAQQAPSRSSPRRRSRRLPRSRPRSRPRPPRLRRHRPPRPRRSRSPSRWPRRPSPVPRRT